MIINKPDEIKRVLAEYKTIAVVGMSPKPERDSNQVGKYLIDKGYDVIPVNPQVPEIYGKKSYPSLLDIPKDKKIDIVDIFRNPEAAKETIVEAAKISPKLVWLQLGAESEDAISTALSLNMDIIYGICIMATHTNISGSPEFIAK